ncbi:MAG: hypothetical protein M3380_20385 [Chloroflexota bacterium]|nr:hypothetical protein [Chloroflexota bacterium]
MNKLELLKQAITQALQNGWRPQEAPWLQSRVMWDFVAILQEERELFVHCTTHKRFHTITSPFEQHEKNMLLQPDFATALGYKVEEIKAWYAKGKEPVQFLEQFVDK